jgi:hypothetical protein
MACPYFMPTQKSEAALWPHPTRLPLGAGWEGQCCAPGSEGSSPSLEELKDSCNLGYATCQRLPQERAADAVRFAVTRDNGSQIGLSFVFESAHRPGGHGILHYDLEQSRWSEEHGDRRLQKMAECYLEAYLLRRIQPAAAGTKVSPHR